MFKYFALIFLLTGLISATYIYSQLGAPLKVSSGEVLLVEKGANLTTIAADLSRRDILPIPASLFRYYGILTAGNETIKVGEYALSAELSVRSLLGKLLRGEVIVRSITFPEGWTTVEWLELLSVTEFVVQTDRAILFAELGEPLVIEGTLFPDTYHYTRGESDLAILKRAQARMKEVLQTAWENRSSEAAVQSIEEAVILASMIEKETGYEPDRPLIASVFNNRLVKGMKLQSDPTVIYGIDEFDGDLRRRHLKINHPFNTYVHQGLPAGPICNPGLASIQVALNPPASPYFYFVAKGNGQSFFSVSLDEHNAAVTRYQKAGRVENYRSTTN